ncbi:MAG: ribonuclease E/G, partial [Actinomycetota bacterium]
MDNNGSGSDSAADTPQSRPVDNRNAGSPSGGADGADSSAAKKRRRGSRGGKNRKKPAGQAGDSAGTNQGNPGSRGPSAPGQGRNPQELPDPPREGKVSDQAVAEQALVRKPQIGDTRPAPAQKAAAPAQKGDGAGNEQRGGSDQRSREAIEAEIIEKRRGRERDGRPVGRYMMCVQVRDGVTQVAVLEGRSLIEHYVSRPADDISQIHGNIYLGRVQNVL